MPEWIGYLPRFCLDEIQRVITTTTRLDTGSDAFEDVISDDIVNVMHPRKRRTGGE